MTIQQLIYAQALAKFSNYSRAAESLSISQPALSLQIKKLEDELGFSIVDRSAKQISITRKGHIFLERSRLLINESQQLRTLAKELKDDKSGVLKIGIIPTLAPYLLPLFIDQLNDTYRDVQILIKEALTQEIIQDLQSGELHGGIISTPITSSIEFEVTPLFYEKFQLFVSHEHPLYLHNTIDIKDIPLADVRLLKEGNCFRDQVKNICELAKQTDRYSRFQFESSSIESLCRIVEFRGGITFLPELTTMHLSAEREDMIKELKGVQKVREISLIHLPNHIFTENLNLFGSVIKENLPKHMLDAKRGKKIPTNINL